MRENDARSQASVEFLVLLAAILIVVGVVVFMTYIASSGLGSEVGEELENTVSEVENLLNMVKFP